MVSYALKRLSDPILLLAAFKAIFFVMNCFTSAAAESGFV